MNFYDVILAGKLQDMTYPANFFDLLFARKLYPADVWEIYEGTLPATFNANGSDMRQYQIYGNTGGVGDEADITGLSEPLCGIDTYTDSLDLSTGILTRRIRKLVLTGNETFTKNLASTTDYLYYAARGVVLPLSISKPPIVCSHLHRVGGAPQGTKTGINTYNDYSVVYLNFGANVMNAQASGNTPNGFKEYLAAQYAAGTPVTIWYVLAVPEVSTITVPSGLTGTIEGYLIQDGTPTPETPIYPTANGVKQADDTYSINGYKLDMGVASLNMINVEPFKIDKQQTSIYVSLYSGKLKPGTYTVAIFQEDSITTSLRNTLMVQIGTSYFFEEATNNYHNNLGWHYLTFTLSSEQSNSYIIIQFWANNLNDDCNYSSSMLLNGSVRPNVFIPYFNETTPIYIGDEPLEKDEYVDYKAGKVYRRTAQVMPSAPAETKTSNGITVTCDGEGHYSISGTATSNATIRFDIPEFVIPISVDGGGDGTFSMFNDFTSQNVKLYFRYGETVIDVWTPYPVNRTQTVYSLMGNETTNGISITVTSGTTINGTISPMFTDNGILPETYTPYLQPTDPPVALPALPTCGGTTIVDYAGQSVAVPEKGLFEYKGGT